MGKEQEKRSMRLDKFLADMGCGTRSDLKKMIRKGCILVDGKAVRDPGTSVTEDSLVILNGEEIHYQTMVYIMINKPDGVISATNDPKQETVVDLITDQTRRDLFPVGRLDKDTEGLLLLSNDGELAHRLLSPKHHVDKTYYAKLDGEVTNEMIDQFGEGLEINDEEPFKALPAVLKPDLHNSAVVTIQEGKYHQIKRMFKMVGREVLYLKRLSMGPLELDENLKPGEYRSLTEEEIKALKDI
jgi:16S rRNA pseudouridine516 synthase